MRALVADLRAKVAADGAGRRRAGPRQARRARQAAAPRADPPAARRRVALPRAVAARRPRHVRRRGPGGRDRHRHRPGERARVRDRRQRRHREGRHLLPADREEAPAGAGDRPGEPAALHLPGRLGRRQPAAAGRGVPGPRPLRPHLLQPGQPVGRRHPADRGGDGLVHRRRRLRAGDVRRERHRQEPGHDLPGRPAAGEGRHRRGGHAPRSWAAPTSTAASRASPTTTPLDDAHALAHRPADRGQPELGEAPGGWRCAARSSRATTRPSCTASSRPTRASPTTSAR